MPTVEEPLLGTRAEVGADAGSVDAVRAVERRVLDEVARLEGVFSLFDPSSALSQLRRTGTTEVPELRTVIELASRWQRRSGGAFHPTARSLIDLWDQAEARGAAPTPTERAQAVERLGDDVARLDLNAIAKGWIADQAVQAGLASTAAQSVWLSLGGDVVHRGTGQVTVGIENPRRPYDNVPPMATVSIANEALATSGGGRRWWTIDGQRYPKIIDPRTGSPVDRLGSATIIAPDGATADVLATIANVLRVPETLELASEVDAACLLVGHDGTVVAASDRFELA